jgi:tripartite-type tricarboxylate transporter receptor subunit TctC
MLGTSKFLSSCAGKTALRGLGGVASLTLALAYAAPANAADSAASYPDHSIRLVLPFPPGGGTDTLARIMAPKMGSMLGQAIVVDNRTGAAGNIASDVVLKADPDGYTVLMGFSTALTMNPLIYKLNFNVERDFKPVNILASGQYVMVIRSDLPAKTVPEFIEYAKAHPGQLNFSSSGAGQPLHLAGELFNLRTGTKIQHVPYKGGGPAVMALLGGQVQLLFGSVTGVQSFVQQGKFRALAVTSLKRSPVFPNLPTLDELGLKGFNVTTWYGMLVPKGTPDAVIAKLGNAAEKVMKDPDVQKSLATQGLELDLGGPKQLADRIKTESAQWADLVKKVHISASE